MKISAFAFKVIERTSFHIQNVKKGQNYVNSVGGIKVLLTYFSHKKVTVLHFCRSPDYVLYLYQVSQYYLI